jgi:hypothetical protein
VRLTSVFDSAVVQIGSTWARIWHRPGCGCRTIELSGVKNLAGFRRCWGCAGSRRHRQRLVGRCVAPGSLCQGEAGGRYGSGEGCGSSGNVCSVGMESCWSLAPARRSVRHSAGCAVGTTHGRAD